MESSFGRIGRFGLRGDDIVGEEIEGCPPSLEVLSQTEQLRYWQSADRQSYADLPIIRMENRSLSTRVRTKSQLAAAAAPRPAPLLSAAALLNNADRYSQEFGGQSSHTRDQQIRLPLFHLNQPPSFLPISSPYYHTGRDR